MITLFAIIQSSVISGQSVFYFPARLTGTWHGKKEINPIQARLFLPFKGPRGVFRALMISGTIKANPMKLCTVIVLFMVYQNIKRNFQKYDL